MKTATFGKVTVTAFEGEKEVENSFSYLNPEWNVATYLQREAATTPLTRIVVSRDGYDTVFFLHDGTWWVDWLNYLGESFRETLEEFVC